MQLRWSKSTRGHAARTIISRRHLMSAKAFVSNVFVSSVDVTSEVVDCAKTAAGEKAAVFACSPPITKQFQY